MLGVEETHLAWLLLESVRAIMGSMSAAAELAVPYLFCPVMMGSSILMQADARRLSPPVASLSSLLDASGRPPSTGAAAGLPTFPQLERTLPQLQRTPPWPLKVHLPDCD